ncbi:MAG: nucleotidyl transferase AbiEii/AbiGii toxin family protein [Chloroflexi bacterium]|nr:nucleotidyl transferase AbiEii/AbiGii toxin family protein [Chloroflexota bacterium]
MVHSAFIRFRGLFHRLGLSPHETEVLAIKLEIDTDPPAPQATPGDDQVQHHVAVNLQHHDRASLLAGKLHALLQRGIRQEGVIGMTFIGILNQPQWALPNFAMLNNALDQSGWRMAPLRPTIGVGMC